MGSGQIRCLGSKSEDNKDEQTKEDKAKEENLEESKESVQEEGEQEEPSGESKKKDLMANDDYWEEDYEPPQTKADRFADVIVTITQLLLLGALLGGAYVTAKELLPGRMKPGTVFSEAAEVVKVHDEILGVVGGGMRVYGRDTGSESRRNHPDERVYVDERDGSNRTRVRFNIKGPRGHVRVWAEVSDKLARNEWVYLIAQCQRTGRVITIEDNRARIDAEASLAGSPSGSRNALAALLGGGDSK
jgi:hypothetical protein